MNLFKSTKAITYISSRGDKVYPIIMDIKTGIVEGDAVFTTGDIDTAYLYTTILEEQSDYNILGSTVICNIQRPDGTTMKVQGDVLGNNLIEFPLGQSGVSQEGIYNFDIAVVFSEKKMVTSPTAQYSVTQSIEVIGEIEEDDRFPVLESLISGINVINEEELVRVSNEEVRQSKEEAREQAESVRVRNEETRLANNEAIRNEEAVRVVNENERKNAESLRVQEEDKRKQQENTRIAQENTRVSQETARVNAENTRKNQEATRQANEATRVSQETNRSQAESTRNSNETVRQNQENTRKNQEQARVTAEGNRITSENVRVSAEQARVLKEQERQAIEVERQNSESTREQQEATRVSQENARKQADILRQQEHESRQQFLDGFEGKLNTVVGDVATIKDDVVSVRETNKRQDVFLQGLYNENLDGRVTVKEEGSVISLTNSDDGLVDIIGLEGNTLVNYVTDGSKELTLNGDIEVEGTSVTLTEGVDNGLVDVACEGNTLINLISPSTNSWGSNMVADGNVISVYRFCNTIQPLKPNTTYTLMLDTMPNNGVNLYFDYTIDNKQILNTGYNYSPNGKFMFTTPQDLQTNGTSFNCTPHINGHAPVEIPDSSKKFMLLEGDWTNKEIPPYFEGMKSVGECEDNKLEIVSQNKNLFDGLMEYGLLNTSTGLPNATATGIRSVNYTKVEPSSTYTVSNTFNYSNYVHEYDEEKNYIKYHKIMTNPATVKLSDKTHYIKIRTTSATDEYDLSAKFQIEKGSTMTSYVQQSINKKEISLSEPLRALPNGVKDKIVEIGGKWYVERNCGEVMLNDGENWNIYRNLDGYKTIHFRSRLIEGMLPPNVEKAWDNNICLSNIFLTDKHYPMYTGEDREFLCISTNINEGILISINKNKLQSQDVQGFKQWLSENPTTVIYELQTPIYEELPIDPTINTYTDVTHISNNSTIPCNMVVKNTGYNAIIKPSTQYTVSFDTDRRGTIGINLAGSKVTTTNNIATVTTPSTLVDDTLRLTGKGIKANNVRLLEGDKTNWIPSYFEGMKSSFEDNKIDIKVMNKNEFDGVWELGDINWESGKLLDSTTSIRSANYVEVKEGLYYTFSFDSTENLAIRLYDKDKKYLGATELLETSHKVYSGDNRKIPKGVCYVRFKINSTNLNLNLQLERGREATNYVPHQSNKTSLLINEPLRGVGDVKDRFVFKEDGKLMIERNCGQVVFDGSEDEGWIYDSGWRDFRWNDLSINQTSTTGNANWALCDKIIFVNYATYLNTVDGSCILFNLDKCIIRNYNINQDIETFKKWLQANPLTVVYKLVEPTYEEVPYETQKLILEGYVNGTLFFDTNIPPTVEASYTANIPVISELNKNSNEIGLTQEDLSVTQVAVDFLLMSNLGEEMLSSFNLNTRGRNSMGAYFANRITKGALKYEDVISKYPQYKEEIDSILEIK